LDASCELRSDRNPSLYVTSLLAKPSASSLPSEEVSISELRVPLPAADSDLVPLPDSDPVPDAVKLRVPSSEADSIDAALMERALALVQAVMGAGGAGAADA